TVERYTGILEHHLKPAFGTVKLSKLRATDLERYYASSSLSPATLELHHTVFYSALASAVRKRIVSRNEADLVDGKPRRRAKNDTTEIREHCWDAGEARAFLEVARKAGSQQFAFYSLDLELGLRKNELAGLMWKDIDLEAGTVRLVHQLTARGSEPSFGPLKSGSPRTLDVSPAVVEALRAHRSHQAKLKIRNRAAYHDHGLVFAKEWKDLSRGRAKLGDPLQTNNIGQREFSKLIKEAGVRSIKFHGLRHTAATLALLMGVPVKVVAERLGHSKTSITLDLYSHVVPGMGKDAAARVGSLLHG
ncbi:MAG: tyrosine-type recombinase/integrase, partial [Vicinamibacteria bacterium]